MMAIKYLTIDNVREPLSKGLEYMKLVLGDEGKVTFDRTPNITETKLHRFARLTLFSPFSFSYRFVREEYVLIHFETPRPRISLLSSEISQAKIIGVIHPERIELSIDGLIDGIIEIGS